MKTLILVSVFLSSYAVASPLQRDFVCSGVTVKKQKFEVSINNLSFSQEVNVSVGTGSCRLSVTTASYGTRRAAPLFMVNFKKKQDCTLKVLPEGFIKMSLGSDPKVAHVLAFYDSQPLACHVTEMNTGNLSKFIKSHYR